MALYKVAIVLAHTPVDLSIQNARLAHPEEVLLAVKGVKEVVLPCCDVPLALQNNTAFLEPFRAKEARKSELLAVQLLPATCCAITSLSHALQGQVSSP